ncbi:MAG TPA: hypothetical protein VNH18_34330 [Bryobacteraceae bacterium]|nr:hypothetical protein [Bryobacteraceae bacterium]
MKDLLLSATPALFIAGLEQEPVLTVDATNGVADSFFDAEERARFSRELHTAEYPLDQLTELRI